MSRIGNNPIEIPQKVGVKIDGNTVSVKGPEGELHDTLPPEVTVRQEDDAVIVNRINETKYAKKMHGLSRSLVENMIIGVNEGYEKNLEVIGVGYKVENLGSGIMLSLGLSHQIYFVPPDGIELETETPKRKVTADGTPNQLLTGKIKVKGPDKQQVGQVAAKIRALKPPDVYKSKGIRYADERVHIKAGKAAV